jgi:alpha-glucosidase
MRKMRNYFVGLMVIIMAVSVSCKPDTVGHVFKSPDRNIHVGFQTTSAGEPVYSVQYKNKLVVDSSRLGFEFAGQEVLNEGLIIKSVDFKNVNEPWENLWGEQRVVENEYTQATFELVEKGDPYRTFNVVFKVYNDGLGFRYEFPEQEALGEVVIQDELTEFNLTGNHMSWWIPGDWEIYEHLFTKSRLSDVDAGAKRNNPYLAQTHIPDPNAVNTPFTMKTDEGIYLSFHEASITDYAGMTLSIDKESYTLRSALVAWEDGTKVKTQTPFVAPWRTIQITDRAGDLIESNLIVNLNEPNKLENTDWIKPSKYIGIWWEMHLGVSSWDLASGKHSATTENAKRYIDFAGEHGFDAVLIEGWNKGWEDWVGDNREGIFDWVTPYPDFDIDEVVKYGKERGVEIVGHHETSGDVGGYEKQLEEVMAFYNQKGIGAVKTGYVGTIIPKTNYHHGQWMVRHYRRALEVAAKNEIMVIAHEPIKATGLRRTYPNMLAREGLRGQEFNAWSDGNPPEHLAIVPFTRMLAGPVDFTPGIFNIKLKKLKGDVGMSENREEVFEHDSYKPDNQVSTTLAKQLSLYVVLYSPVQMAADLPQHYEGHPAFQFIKDVPVDWEESHVLDGEIGEYVIIARKERDGNDWYIGGLSNEKERSTLIDFSFLDGGYKYEAMAYMDGDNAHWDDDPLDYKIESFTVTSNDKKVFEMAPGGGFALQLKRVDN